MGSRQVGLTENLKDFLRILPNEILNSSENNMIREETIYNLTFGLRNSKDIPFYPRSIGPFDTYSIDIHYCIAVMETSGFLNQIMSQDPCKAFYVDPVKRRIDIDQLSSKTQILTSCVVKVENEFKLGNRVCPFVDFLSEENYLFTHLGCLNRKSGLIVDLKQVGINNFRELLESEPREHMRRPGFEKRILSYLGKSILTHYHELYPHNLRLASLKEAYKKNEEQIKGKLVAVVGIFENEYEKVSTDFVYDFGDSIILDKNHRIRVLFGEDGDFLCRRSLLSNRECLLLGFVEPFSDEEALRAAGVITICSEKESVPCSIALSEAHVSQESEPVIIVGEKNHSETRVTG
ncbi:MAG: hypothetical protein HXS54_03275 [Theionarchaea archaeon]|nr:hypothetical protein [Theionarchaea archaeon]